MSFEHTNPVHVVAALNEQRGCPYTMSKATEIGTAPVEELSPDVRKQEYYYLLDGVLEKVIDNVRDFKESYPFGLVELNEKGEPESSLITMLERVRPCVLAGDFIGATYWTHEAIYRTIDAATQKWEAETDTTSEAYQRISKLVDDPRQETYGEHAVKARVASAANQTVHISASMQRMTHHLFTEATGHTMTPKEMERAHAANMKFAMPMTNLHLLETRPLREVFGSESLPGGNIQLYTRSEFFTFADGALHPQGDRMIQEMAKYNGAFPDGRIGCPGNKYIPEIWQWTGGLSSEFAMPALLPSELSFRVPGAISKQ